MKRESDDASSSGPDPPAESAVSLRAAEKRIRTTMIGALAAVEEGIGRELWGQGRLEEECTPEQLRWRRIWLERVRPAVLDTGNTQVRALRTPCPTTHSGATHSGAKSSGAKKTENEEGKREGRA